MDKNNQIFPNWKEISKILKYKKQDFDNLLENYIKHKKEVYKKIKSIKKEDRNFENTILALEDDKFEDYIHQIFIFAESHVDKSYRDLANDFRKNIGEKMIDVEHDKEIYFAVKEYFEGNYKKEKKNLDNKYGAGSVKLVEDYFKSYKRMGFDLPKAKQDKLKKNSKNISNLSVKFIENVNDYKDFILCTKEELEGFPEADFSILEKEGDKYKISINDFQFIPFIKFAKNPEKRKELYKKRLHRGGQSNIKILSDILKLRKENSNILNYKNHADFVSENRMAKNEKNIRKFLEGIINKLNKNSKKELKELLDFSKNNLEEYKNIKKIEYFDQAYIANKLREKKYSIDSSKLKEYFELENVLKQMFSIFGELFNFSVRELDIKEKKEKDISFFDKDIRVFEIKEKGKIISYLILDLFVRDGKHNGACSAEFIDGGSSFLDGEFKLKIPVNYILCNFSKSNKKTPSLLTIRDVETLFHEFGHSLHYMLTKAKYVSQAGYCTVWDFVETPSQFMENFLYEEENLKKLSKHYKTGKSLDKSIIKKIIESRNFLNNLSFLGIFVASLFDLDIHSKNIRNIAKYYNELQKKYFDFNNDNIFPAGFHHLVGGYDAGYYSYMWALVYAQDFYSEFKKVMGDKNKLKEIGERYRKEILEVGGSREEMESVKKFLGRNPNNKAFLETVGAK